VIILNKLIFIGGTMGVGKTTTSKSLHQELQPSIWLDGDWCWQMNPWDFNNENKLMVIDNILHLLNNYISNPHFKFIIFSWVMHKQDIIDEILSHLDLNHTKLYQFSLVCDEESLKQRMKSDNRKDDVIELSINRLNLYKQLNTMQINTSHLDIPSVTEELIKIIKVE